VLSRALAAGTSSPPSGGGGGGGGSAAATPTATPVPQYSDAVAAGPRVVAPATPADSQAVADAAAHGGQGDTIAGRPLAPAANINGRFGRNALPGTLIVVIVLLAGAALAFVVPTVRRRVRARQAP
jgi:hypothetical protein